MQKRVLAMLILLITQFILGMLMNLFAVPPSDPKFTTEPLFIKLVFALHGLNGLVLPFFALSILFFARKSGNQIFKNTTLFGLISVLTAAVGGILTVLLKDTASEFASLIMAISFLSAFITYGRIYYLLRE